MSKVNAEYQASLDEMIREGKLKAEYKDILLEIADFGSKACNLGLICGLGWGKMLIKSFSMNMKYSIKKVIFGI
ncbi:hypothetical protein BV372_01150 [Nostoc sp. T09]|uniref:hypothetical protein n=1 Tax=Nostoc sp. T09 TaxID=1932621 RepID=UPI000A389793|nr:hypothetical protein [Nostoc sp. T09]OUL37597.1 hypothetical protein BV372_01150 [Nostoc sp. T09]